MSAHTTPELAARLAVSVAGIAQSGFKHVGAEVYERRLEACRRCPHLVDPPPMLAYALARTVLTDTRVCDQCGCMVAKKARYGAESCPVADPEDASRTRWGEPAGG